MKKHILQHEKCGVQMTDVLSVVTFAVSSSPCIPCYLGVKSVRASGTTSPSRFAVTIKSHTLSGTVSAIVIRKLFNSETSRRVDSS